MSAIQREVVGLINAQRWAAFGSVDDGQPLVSMIAYAVEPGLDGLLIFISQLAAHTRALLEDARCAVAITAPDTGEGDPQLLPRVSLTGHARVIPRGDTAFDAAAARYVERFPDAAPRFQLGDFVLMRVSVDNARYVGGFARAASFTGDQIRSTARGPAATDTRA
jgi:putative heme iron utilization protein